MYLCIKKLNLRNIYDFDSTPFFFYYLLLLQELRAN